MGGALIGISAAWAPLAHIKNTAAARIVDRMRMFCPQALPTTIAELGQKNVAGEPQLSEKCSCAVWFDHAARPCAPRQARRVRAGSFASQVVRTASLCSAASG